MNNTTKPAAPAPCQTRRMIPKIGPETIKRASDHLVRMGSSRSPWYRARTGTSITVRLVRRSTTSRTFSGISTVTVGTSAPMRRPAEQWMARPPGLTRTRQRMLLTYRLLCAVRWVNCTMLSMDIRTEQFGSDLTRTMPGAAVLVSILAWKARTISPAATSPAAIPASRHHAPPASSAMPANSCPADRAERSGARQGERTGQQLTKRREIDRLDHEGAGPTLRCPGHTVRVPVGRHHHGGQTWVRAFHGLQ